MVQVGLFDFGDRLKDISKFGDPLERLSKVVDFKVFRKDLDEALSFSNQGKDGRPAYDAVLMFKMLVLQALYNLSDDQVEYQIKDRLSFMRFLGLSISHRIPDVLISSAKDPNEPHLKGPIQPQHKGAKVTAP